MSFLDCNFKAEMKIYIICLKIKRNHGLTKSILSEADFTIRLIYSYLLVIESQGLTPRKLWSGVEHTPCTPLAFAGNSKVH